MTTILMDFFWCVKNNPISMKRHTSKNEKLYKPGKCNSLTAYGFSPGYLVD